MYNYSIEMQMLVTDKFFLFMMPSNKPTSLVKDLLKKLKKWSLM